MQRIIIHVGTEKTGSKALQSVLTSAAGDALAYPAHGSGIWHRDVHEGLRAGDPAPLRAALDAMQGAPVGVLSYETFHRLPDAALDVMAAEARRRADRIEAAVLLRRQDDYAESMANQLWKSHRGRWPGVARRIEAMCAFDESLDWDRLVARLEARFDAVFASVYEKGVSSVASFAEATGLTLAAPPRRGKDPNPAGSAVEVATLQEIKRRAGPHPEIVDIVEATRLALARPGWRRWLASRRDGPARLLDDATRARLMERAAPSNERLRARRFADRDTLFGPSTAPGGPLTTPAPRADVVREVSRRFGLRAAD